MNANPESYIFIDTNILVYAYDLSAGLKNKIAFQLIENCWESGKGCISIQVLQEFYVTVTKKLAQPLDSQTARQIVADLVHWRLHTPDATDLLQAIDIQGHYQLSFWDAMVLQSGSRLGCAQIFTEDLSHSQKYGDIQVINPFFLTQII